MKKLFQPAIFIMERLTFPAKFFLVTAVFAIPLVFTSIQSILSIKVLINEDEKRLNGISLVDEVNRLLPFLESARDLSIVRRLGNAPEIDKVYAESKNQALNKIDELVSQKELGYQQYYQLLLNGLRSGLSTEHVSSGSEADTANTIYENSNQIINEALELKRFIINNTGISGDIAPLTKIALDILNDEIPDIREEMGRSRAYGVYYLQSKFLTSTDIELLEKNHASLLDKERKLREKLKLLVSSPKATLDQNIFDIQLLNSITDLAMLIEDKMLFDVDLDTNWKNYYEISTKYIASVIQLQKDISSFVSYRIDHRIKENERVLLERSLGIGTLSLFATYLFIGFYLASRSSVDALVRAARKVARGELKHTVRISAKDEMQELAEVMDDMRQQLQLRQTQLVEMTITDGLTKIHNRTFFNQELHDQLTKKRESDSPVSLLLIDVDHFKQLNDIHGHQAGDISLQHIAQTISCTLERSEDTVSRYGGEEFAVILPTTSSEGAFRLAERVAQKVREHVIQISDEKALKVTVSIGTATTSSTVNTMEKLIKSADDALYEAKDGGRNRCVSAS